MTGTKSKSCHCRNRTDGGPRQTPDFDLRALCILQGLTFRQTPRLPCSRLKVRATTYFLPSFTLAIPALDVLKPRVTSGSSSAGTPQKEQHSGSGPGAGNRACSARRWRGVSLGPALSSTLRGSECRESHPSPALRSPHPSWDGHLRAGELAQVTI